MENIKKINKELEKLGELSPPDMINDWVDEYLEGNGISRGDLNYYHDAGTSIINFLRDSGFELKRVKSN